jgi:flagellar biosynthetic protein FliQ
MTFADALTFGRHAIFVAVVVASPALLLGLLTGLTVSVFQTVTQIQEPTLTFIPKILAVAVVVVFFGPFMLAMLTDFTSQTFMNMPAYVK